MYFDSQEVQEVKVLVTVAEGKFKMKILDETSACHQVRLTVLTVLYLGGIFAITFSFNQYSFLAWPLCLLFCSLIWISNWRRKSQLEKYMPGNIWSWWQEIEDINVGFHEREMFCRLIASIQTGDSRETHEVLCQVLKSPCLSKLAFIQVLAKKNLVNY